ncbi:MAG: hypothetical protein ACYTFA_12975 [Planctomycetota bacterium]
MIATVDPIQSIYSTGWLYRRAISGGRWPLAFWGMWLVFGSFLLVGLFGGIWGGGWLSFPIAYLVCLLYLAILYRVTKAYVRHLRFKPGTCEECGYILAHLPESRCPECGTRFWPEEPQRDSDADAAPEWMPPDSSAVAEVDLPFGCYACGWELSGLGEEGSCPECGIVFNREERLFDLYGPEVFVSGASAPVARVAKPSKYRAAIALTLAAAAALPIMHWLSEEGFIPFDRWVFVLLIFVAAGAEWLRASRTAPAEPQAGEQPDENPDQPESET